MAARFILIASALLPILAGQNLPQRSKLSDYAVHAQLPAFDLGAQFLIHEIPGDKGPFASNDYLVVEVAIFPTSADGVHMSRNDFTLRVNEKKIVDTASPQAVAAALRVANWDQRPTSSTSGIGSPPVLGDPGVIPGASERGGGFPGEPNANGVPSEGFPPSRNNSDPYSVAPERDFAIEQAIGNVALPGGLIQKPVKGCLFFRYSGKLKSIRSLDLVYAGSNGAHTEVALIKPEEK